MKEIFMQKYLRLGMLFLFFGVVASCSSSDESPEYEFPDPIVEELISLPEEWVLQESYELSSGIEVYRNTTPFQGKDMNAYAVVFDPKDTGIEFKPFLAGSAKTPSALFAAEEGTPLAAINGGFFGPGVSYSLVKTDGEIEAANIQVLNRPLGDGTAAYYPTRAAFGLGSDNTPEVTWMYNLDANAMYSYPSVSPNKLNVAPQPQPSAEFPAKGEVWNVNDAIGGSPMLIWDGKINITDEEELVVIDNHTSRARSAIGHTADGKVILLAVEGNNPEGGAGLDLEELAELLKSMGCTGAINLDGGGSTSMIVAGEQTVKPSSSRERAVMSVIFVKKK